MQKLRSFGSKLCELRVTLLFVSFLFLVAVFQAQAQEQITITTYYPSPYGVYQGLEARRMVIGTANTTNPMPTIDGLINFEGRAADPAFFNAGTMYYNSTRNVYRYYDGTQWLDIGTGCVRINYSQNGDTPCPSGYHVPVDAYAYHGSGDFLCCAYR